MMFFIVKTKKTSFKKNKYHLKKKKKTVHDPFNIWSPNRHSTE